MPRTCGESLAFGYVDEWELFEIVEEGGHACEGFLGRVLDLDGELDLCLRHTAQILDGLQVGYETDALT